MTYLEALKILLGNYSGEGILDDQFYINIGIIKGIDVTSNYVYSDENYDDLMILKLEVLGCILSNGELLTNFSKGEVSKDFTKDLLLKERDRLISRFPKGRRNLR